ncbi:MAG TPA: isoleucine--tRNA ligase [Acidimicrobiia bacterium]|nr:isoleucine--tRNA ligase [Acidimicrobiia bacterium]
MTPEARTNVFQPLSGQPDHDGLERHILEWWDVDGTFSKLRQKTAGAEPFSFIDGPVTANKTLGVHTAWGRTLKDVIQRYKAAKGFDLRYQNGFDCQGLWIEVGVEQELGLNSKKDIEAFGLEEFARRCREKVAWSVRELRRGSRRLGMWMDWDHDYLTFSDNNIEYIWKFLKTLDDRNWLYLGHRSTEWCPRCGTSISQHEITGQSGVYQEKSDPSLYVRFPLIDRDDEALVVWTTTPWTLPANVSAAIHPDHEYGRRPNGDWVAVERFPEDEFVERKPGHQMVGWAYRAPFEDLPAGIGVDHVVIPWDEVTMEQGTGVVHIAPGAGSEDFDLGTVHGLPVLMPVDGGGRFYPDYGWLAGMSTEEAKQPIIDALEEKGVLVEAGEYVHSYPHCWRCDTPLIFRVADDWYISVEEIRQPLKDANATVDWTPPYMGKLMDDWLNNMGDWNISRRRYYGLPLPFYPCECGHVTVIGSKKELEDKATAGFSQLEELRRPWIDRVTIRCDQCGNTELRRIEEVGDVWLDAGIVPFSTLGWNNPEWVSKGNANGAADGLTYADLPDHQYWQTWFPADWVSEMREQVRLWFYSQLFMSVALEGVAPFRSVLGYEKMLAEDGREMHGSWGNLISAEDAFENMGADVMRWMYCAHPPDRNLLFGYEGAHEVRRKLLTLWNSARFLIDYGNIEGFTPTYRDLDGGPSGIELTTTDRWLLARAGQAVAESEKSLDRLRTDEQIASFEAYLDDLSNWYIRRSRRRFYDFDEAAFRTLWVGVVTAVRIIAPVMPFLTEHLWSILVAGPCPDAPGSVHLAGWPASPGDVDVELLAEMESVRRVVEAGRRARMEANIKLRQPLRRVVVRNADLARAHAGEILDELRVKEISFDEDTTVEVTVKPNFPMAGPRLGPRIKDVAAALARGDYEDRPDGGVEAAGETLGPDEVTRTEKVILEGWVVAHDGNISVAIDPSLDDELILEGRALELIRTINEERKMAALDLTDRIKLRLGAEHSDVVAEHRDWIAAEVLATAIELDGPDGAIELEVDIEYR